jgi:hypothetical protein
MIEDVIREFWLSRLCLLLFGLDLSRPPARASGANGCPSGYVQFTPLSMHNIQLGCVSSHFFLLFRLFPFSVSSCLPDREGIQYQFIHPHLDRVSLGFLDIYSVRGRT